MKTPIRRPDPKMQTRKIRPLYFLTSLRILLRFLVENYHSSGFKACYHTPVLISYFRLFVPIDLQAFKNCVHFGGFSFP